MTKAEGMPWCPHLHQDGCVLGQGKGNRAAAGAIPGTADDGGRISSRYRQNPREKWQEAAFRGARQPRSPLPIRAGVPCPPKIKPHSPLTIVGVAPPHASSPLPPLSTHHRGRCPPHGPQSWQSEPRSQRTGSAGLSGGAAVVRRPSSHTPSLACSRCIEEEGVRGTTHHPWPVGAEKEIRGPGGAVWTQSRYFPNSPKLRAPQPTPAHFVRANSDSHHIPKRLNGLRTLQPRCQHIVACVSHVAHQPPRPKGTIAATPCSMCRCTSSLQAGSAFRASPL